jgi:hypothetical protein
MFLHVKKRNADIKKPMQAAHDLIHFFGSYCVFNHNRVWNVGLAEYWINVGSVEGAFSAVLFIRQSINPAFHFIHVFRCAGLYMK